MNCPIIPIYSSLFSYSSPNELWVSKFKETNPDITREKAHLQRESAMCRPAQWKPTHGKQWPQCWIIPFIGMVSWMVLFLVWLLGFPVLHLILHIRFFSIMKQCKRKQRIIIRLWILRTQICQEWETPSLRSFVPDLSTDFSKCFTLDESSLQQFCNCGNGWEFWLGKTFSHS